MLIQGWKHSRLLNVALQRIAPTGEVLNSATLITSDGCVNPKMRAICPNPPTFEPPLGHQMRFRAVLFQGMNSGDEIFMSVRVVGCIESHDCTGTVSLRIQSQNLLFNGENLFFHFSNFTAECACVFRLNKRNVEPVYLCRDD